jgi:uncharacterized membrane protein YedE/YeeE
MHPFLNAFLGGMLLGIAASIYLLVHGRITGISGMIDQMLQRNTWQGRGQSPVVWFIAGLTVTPCLYTQVSQPQIQMTTSPGLLIIAGLLVGFGTRFGSGCTSGHGICGISRLSPRSLIATMTFMLTGFVTVYIIRHVAGIAL